MSTLKLKLYQPSAHYRLPFTFQRRLTYPLPPFSTVKGLIANLLGIQSDEDAHYKQLLGISLAVFGSYETQLEEYVWMRNMSAKAHNERFGSPTNRVLDSEVEHPGGQSPTKIDVLENVYLTIYLSHQDRGFLEEVERSFHCPQKRNGPPHLGRAEDLIVVEDVCFVTPEIRKIFHVPCFTWLPQRTHATINGYDAFYEKISGNFMRMPTFYTIQNGQRLFDQFIEVKLFEGGSFRGVETPTDPKTELPLFLSRLWVGERTSE